MKRHPPGFILPLLVIVLAVSVVTIVAMQLTGESSQTRRTRNSAAALAQAKEALLAGAASGDLLSQDTLYGVLLCPDLGHGMNNTLEGAEMGNCGSAFISSLGRLPRQSLKLDRLLDGDNECIWYAVSGQHKSPQFKNPIVSSAGAKDRIMLNEDTPALLRAVNQNNVALADDDQIVALLFAAGAPLASQNRTRSTTDNVAVCGGNYSASNYLDRFAGFNNAAVNTTANGLSTFVQAPLSDSFNDHLLPITRKEVFDAATRRSDFLSNMQDIALALGACMANSKTFPNATQVNLGSAWDDYANPSNYVAAAGQLSGRLPSISGCTLSPPLDIVYKHWKDHFFYAVSAPFVGTVTSSTPANLCTGNNCLTVNGGASPQAAIIFFSGVRLSNQTRAGATLADIHQYLEGRNASNHPNAGGNADYQSTAASNGFNDVLICIPANLGTPTKC